MNLFLISLSEDVTIKNSISTLFILTLIVSGCSTTTYLNLKQTSPEHIEKEFNKVEKDSAIGVEVSILLKNADGFKDGELLFVRESTIIVCSEYSALEDELISHFIDIFL